MTENEENLNDREYERLKNLVESGRKYHYRNFVFSGLVFVLLLKDENEILKLVLDVELPVNILMIILYFLTIVYTVITIDIFNSIYTVVRTNFEKKIPFNWIVLTGKQTKLLSGFLIILPLIICFVAVALSKIPIDKGSLFFLGLFGISFPSYIKDFTYKISRKVDSNGQKITLSIYILYWYRIIRNIFFLIYFVFPIFYFFNQSGQSIDFNKLYLDNIVFCGIFCGILIIIRILGELLHKKINRIGVRHGFEEEYKKNSA